MSNPTTPASSTASAAVSSVANRPATMVVAGILALALGSAGVAFYMGKKASPQPLAATESATQAKAKADAIAKAKADQDKVNAIVQATQEGGQSVSETVYKAPEEAAPLGGTFVDQSTLGESDPSLK